MSHGRTTGRPHSGPTGEPDGSGSGVEQAADSCVSGDWAGDRSEHRPGLGASGPTRRALLLRAGTGALALFAGVTAVSLARREPTPAKEPRSAPEHFGAAWMVLATEDDAAKQRARSAGATHGHVRAFWDRLQSTESGAVDAESVLREIAAVRSAGLKVCLEVCLQYPPAFARDGLPRLRDQDGIEWSPAQESGDNIRDWIWSARGRAAVADFLDRLFAHLDWSQIERVKLGGLARGELQYPPSTDVPRYWAYSDAAQGMGQDLATGMRVCPVPGHLITAADPTTGAGTGWSTADAQLAAWYVESLVSWMTWLIARFREHFDGPVYVMHPGAGIRSGSQTPTSTGQAFNFQINLATGLDWDAAVAAYPDELVRPYSTWIDADHFGVSAGRSMADGDAAPWQALLTTARRYGRAGRLWGENTGGQSAADLERIVQQAVAHGYEGLAWLDDATLCSDQGAGYADLQAVITGSG